MPDNLLYEEELIIKWEDLNNIRNKLADLLIKHNIDKNEIETAIIIMNELLENICKYSEIKIANISINKNDNIKNVLSIRIENPISDFNKKNIKELKKEIKRVNSFFNIEDLMLSSINRIKRYKLYQSKLGFSLIRKLAKGSKIILSKSSKYQEGLSFLVEMPL